MAKTNNSLMTTLHSSMFPLTSTLMRAVISLVPPEYNNKQENLREKAKEEIPVPLSLRAGTEVGEGEVV